MNRYLPMLLLTAALAGASAQGLETPAALPMAPAPAAQMPQVSRQSVLRVPFALPESAVSAVIAQRLPEGARYLPGSSEWDGQALPDPLIGKNGTLYFRLEAPAQGTLRFRVVHGDTLAELELPALRLHFPGGREDVVSGRFDAADYASAAAPHNAENPGRLRLPLEGRVFRDRDRITVALEGQASDDLNVQLNGEPLARELIGKRTFDPATGAVRVEYIGVRLRPGRNLITGGGESVQVFLAGRPERLELEPLRLVADGSNPIELRLRALDANGVATGTSFVSVESNFEFLGEDANPGMAGYQLRLEGGEARVRLRPRTTPGELNIRLTLDELSLERSFRVAPDERTVGVGQLSATVGISQPSLGVTARAYLEAPLGDGKVYLAGSSDGLPTEPTAGSGFALTGDASTLEVPLQGLDPVAFRYDEDNFTLAYRQAPLPIDALPISGDYTALTLQTRGQDLSASGFAGRVPNATVHEQVVPDGTRLYILHRVPIEPGSESVERVVRDRLTGLEVRRTRLVRLVDYTLDPQTGALEFVRPYTAFDEQLNTQTLEVTYRPVDAGSHRSAAFGAQLSARFGHWTASLAGAYLQDQTSFGARLRYEVGTDRLDLRAATASGGVQLSAEGSTRSSAFEASGRVSYQDAAYDGPGASRVGTYAEGRVSADLGGGFKAVGRAEIAASDSEDRRRLETTVDYSADPWRVGAGLRLDLGNPAGLSLVGRGGYRNDRFSVDLSHAQSLSDVPSETELSARYALTRDVSVFARTQVNWLTGARSAFGLEGRLGGTNLSVAYELPGASGDGNRARFGADATLGLSDRVSLGLNGASSYDFVRDQAEFSLGSSLRYKSDELSATLGTDFSVRGGQLKTVVRGGITDSLSDGFSVGADVLSEFGASRGDRVSLSAALRESDWNSLGYLRFADGSLSGGRPELTAQWATTYQQADYQLRAALDARYLPSDPGSFALQTQLGATAYLNDRFGLGAVLRALSLPVAGTTEWGLGLEGSLRVLPGTWATLGYNPTGFSGIGSRYTLPGVYLRFDLLLDEVNGPLGGK
ncbi:hypothetical protein HNR42_001242 [Deinobacterium chartae]|uniref:Outer membrane usher protein n=1 Tax=Deinobacterium chartae TaxID=521158 RepID=A0A841I056_9DEIO|nr:hypothetical protein [Deinobacterium chartae]MBB6097819.1 hypothetical protein [Deinobacterium chartae]